MNTILKKVTLLLMAALAVVATSCSDDLAAVDSIAVDNLSGDRTITFTATVEAETRGYTAISLFDYYRIYAYNTVEGLFIDGAEMKFADNEWTIDATYEMPGSGTSYFFAVSDQAIENSGVAFVEDGADSYIDYTMPADVEDQPILLMAKSEESDGSSFVINFAFKYILTPVALEASGDYYTIEEVTISNYYNSAKFSFKADDDGNLSTDNITYPTSKDGSYTIAPDPGVTSGAITNATSGWLMMPPQSTEGFVLDITSYHYDDGVKDSDTNGVREAIIEGDNIAQLEMGSSYTFKISTNQIASEPEAENNYKDATNGYDYVGATGGDSNCYIICRGGNSEIVYHIPIESRINLFWGDESELYYENVPANTIDENNRSEISIDQLWYDSVEDPESEGLEVDLVTTADGTKVMQVVVPAGYNNDGNTVYAVKNGETTLWSWHLWMTNYNPTSTYMNRFVGQKESTAIDGAMVYQFGRKDPFSAGHYTEEDSTTTVATAVQNPTVRYGATVSTYFKRWSTDITFSTSSGVWADPAVGNPETNDAYRTYKSIYDPSPYGYRVPYESYYSPTDLPSLLYASTSAFKTTYITISGYTFYCTDSIVDSPAIADYYGSVYSVNFWVSKIGTITPNSTQVPGVTVFNAYYKSSNDCSSVYTMYGRARDLFPVFPVKM